MAPRMPLPRDVSEHVFVRKMSFKVEQQNDTLDNASPTTTSPEIVRKKELGNLGMKQTEVPKKNIVQQLKYIKTEHEALADIILRPTVGPSKSGLMIFNENLKKNADMLTAKGIRDATLFHVIIDAMLDMVTYEDNTELIRTVPSVAREFLEVLIIKNPNLLVDATNQGFRPLDMAVDKLKPVVFLAADLILSTETLKDLPVKECPVKTRTRSPGLCPLKLPSSLQSVFERQPKGMESIVYVSGACLHDRVKVEELGTFMDDYKKTMKQALRPPETEGKRGSVETVLHTLIDEASFTMEGSSVKATSFQRIIELSDDETLMSPDGQGYCPLHKAILLYEKESLDFDRLHDVIQSLVQKCPESIYVEVKSSDEKVPKAKAYALLLGIDLRKGQPDEEKKLSWERTEKLLKHTCIGGDKDRDVKLTYIYGKLKDAKDIYLDLVAEGFHERQDVGNISDTVKFQFDTALEYVSLRHDDLRTKKEYILPPYANTRPAERDPYLDVFQWLHTGWPVEKIFKVVVDDLVPYPHTDEAIRTSLKPFHVEIWDWRKLDISTKTVIEAAPTTRELYLHSSGNEAVLQSWACEHGLVRLTELKKVIVTMHPDLRESKEDCKTYFDDFKRDLCRRVPGLDVSLKWPGDSPGQSNDPGDPGSSLESTHESNEVAWVSAMTPFIEFLKAIADTEMEDIENPACVKIALIDDGVASTAKEIPQVSRGKSYYGERDAKIQFRDFHSGPSKHGTHMASCIYKVCPMVQLFVARLDDSVPQLDKFTVDSATKAIKWAISMEVDVISMSWTFSTKDSNDETELTEFDKAIKEAHSKGIILFSSLNDKEMTIFKDYFPVSCEEVIRIGSASKWGEKAESSQKGWAHFLFPGKEIPLKNPDDTQQVVSGSSLATAFAAGLAGMIIYTTRALPLLDYTLSDSERNQLKKQLDSASTKTGMQQIFKVLAGKPTERNPEDLFVDLGSHFSKEPEKEADQSGKVQVLRSLLTQLMLLR